MYFAEHRFLGDTVDISKDRQSGVSTLATPLTLENGLVVTYGEINGFAGDYFGLDKPISSDGSLEKRKDIFQRWFDLLGFSPGGKPKAEAIRTELKIMNDKADKVLRSASNNAAEELAEVYRKTPLDLQQLNKVSTDQRWTNGASFMQLLEANIDHFGPEARLTYDAGHALALDWAAKGDLSKALAINGFADHFLEDSFAAGHMRVPRADIAEVSTHTMVVVPYFSKLINASSSVMHEEDGELGLWVESPSGEKWKAFGDGRLPGKDTTNGATTSNLDQCRKALQASINEVHDTHSSGQIIQTSQFTAWQHAPIIERISPNPDNHSPLVKVEGGKLFRRVNGPKSQKYEETSEFTAWLAFYQENFSRVEAQVRLMVQKFLGITL